MIPSECVPGWEHPWLLPSQVYRYKGKTLFSNHIRCSQCLPARKEGQHGWRLTDVNGARVYLQFTVKPGSEVVWQPSRKQRAGGVESQAQDYWKHDRTSKKRKIFPEKEQDPTT